MLKKCMLIFKNFWITNNQKAMNEIESLQIAIASTLGIVPTPSQSQKILEKFRLVKSKNLEVTIAQLKNINNGHKEISN